MSVRLQEPSAVVSTSPVELLFVEHSTDDVELMLLELDKAGFQNHHAIVESKSQFCDAINSHSFDAVVSDFNLPGWNGLEVLRELRANDLVTPFLLVTGSLGGEAAVDCTKQGVSDSCPKNI